ncbi:MAG: DUF3795 domain-containing protein [Patescibacteria group bacterium]|jgi:hypothetical protein
MKSIDEQLIAPCGMDCGVCKAHLREKNPCHGCNFADDSKPKTRVNCKIKNCQERRGKFCFECSKFPCELLSHLDKRYREKYGMGQIENLECIRREGMCAFLESERKKYESEKGIYCVHDKKYYSQPD